jgi:hypothetical protein
MLGFFKTTNGHETEKNFVMFLAVILRKPSFGLPDVSKYNLKTTVWLGRRLEV